MCKRNDWYPWEACSTSRSQSFTEARGLFIDYHSLAESDWQSMWRVVVRAHWRRLF
jgi:hypothetical protein